jgi:hypothetical protein
MQVRTDSIFIYESATYSRLRAFTEIDLSSGDVAAPIFLGPAGGAVSAYPASGSTVTVWLSTSTPTSINTDIAANLLTHTNLTGDQVAAGLKSRWMRWSPGSVTIATNLAQVECAGCTAVLAESTGGAARFEVAQ